jgi:hypothetical protein
MSDVYGVSNEYLYSEYFLDSYDNSGKANIAYAATDWPRFELGGKIPLKGVVAMKFVSLEVPFSYYIFKSSNNTFSLAENGGSNTTITIPVGNYTSGEITTLLSSLLTAATGVGATYVVTISNQTNKLTFTGSGGTLATFILTFGSVGGTGNTSPRLYLGFEGGSTSSTGLVLTAPNPVNLAGANYLYLNSLAIGSLLDCNLPFGARNLGGGNGSIQVARIPVNAAPGGTIFYNDPIPDFWFDVGNIENLQSFDLYLSLGNQGSTATIVPLELNGLNFSVKVGILRRQTTDDRVQGGGFDQGRVAKRSRPF